IAPYGPFQCVDGRQVFLGIQNEREWEVFCRDILDLPEISTDPRFADNSQRVAHRDELTALINGAFGVMELPTVVQRLEAVGIANAELRDMTQFFKHEQLEARQ